MPIRWQDIFEAVGQSIMILDTEHRILAVNRATLELTGLDPDELLGMRCHDVMHKSELPPEMCPVSRLLQSGGFEREDMEVEALDKFFLVSCSPIYDEEGRLKNIIHIASDITETKHLQRSTEERMKEKELLMDIIQHDLGNIHQGIKVFLQLAMEMKGKNRELMVKGALESSSKAERLIQNLKNLDRINENKFKNVELDPGQTLREAVEISRLLHPDKKVDINISSGTLDRTIKGNDLLKELFINLIDNAIKYGSENGDTIDIRIDEMDDSLEVLIMDEGPGIPENIKELVFDRFERGDDSLEKGTGLGLSIARSIADMIRARIEIIDRPDGKSGNCFRVLF